MSFTLLGILNSQASGAAQAYFLSVLGGAGSEEGNSVNLDSENNIYTTGRTFSTGAGSSDALIAKYDSSGSIQWQRTLGGAALDNSNSGTTDSLDNLYITGVNGSGGGGGSDFFVAKYNSSGTIQFQKSIQGSDDDVSQSIITDSLDNIYTFGNTKSFGAGGTDFLLIKYDSAGTIQWQRVLGGAGFDNGNGIGVDSSNNIYVCGSTSSTGAGGTDFLLAKYNSSGTIQWQRVLGGADGEVAYSVAIDSGDNVYIIGLTNSTGAGGNDFLLAKYNSSGTIQWQRVLGGSGFDVGRSVAIDSEDNVYAFGQTGSTGAGGQDYLIAKYDSAGTIQWQRSLGGSGSDTGLSIATDTLDNLYVLGQGSTSSLSTVFLLGKLPNDGSLEGTYSLDGTNIIYQAASLTAATSSLTAATSSLTSATSSLTSATSSLTDASASLTVETIEI